jgi:hypothetical protein
MIIETHEDVTRAVLAEMHRTPDARTKEILAALVTHLHAFVREVRLTEEEFQAAIGFVNAIGQKTTPSHNEAMLLSGSLGVSNLVCLLNNGALGTRPTQAEMNLRGIFTTGPDGSFAFRSVKPAGYPVPTDGPTGVLLAAQRRHNMRPAHLHFLIYKPGFKTIASQVYDPEDPHLETDSQFGVTKALIANYAKRGDGSYALEFRFVLEAGEARMPKAPITGKAAAA